MEHPLTAVRSFSFLPFISAISFRIVIVEKLLYVGVKEASGV